MKIIFLVVVCFFFQRSSGQNAPSLPQTISKLILENCAICSLNPKDSTHIFLQSDDYSTAEIDYHICHVYFSANQTDSTYKYVLQTITDLQNTKIDVKNSIVLYMKAKVLFRKHLFINSLQEYLKLINNPVVNLDIKINICPNIGEIYLAQKDYVNALFYLKECINKYPVKRIYTLKNIYSNIAICYLHINNNAEANSYFKKSIAISEKLKDTAGIASCYINIGTQYYSLFQDDSAMRYFKKGLQLSLLTNDKQLKQEGLYNMAIITENKKQYSAALNFRKKYEVVHDSIYSQDNIWGLAQLELKLAVQAQEQKVLLMKQVNKLQVLELSKQKVQRNIFFSLAIIFMFFTAYAYYVYNQKNKQNKIIFIQRQQLDTLNTTKNQLFSIVAHDLRSPVQTVKNVLIRLQTALSVKDIPKAQLALTEIAEISNSTFKLLNNLLYWALSQTDQLHFANDKLQIKRIIEQVCYDYISIAAQKNISLQNQVSETVFCLGDINTIKIIFRNLIDNAIKYSNNHSEIVITATVSNDECKVTIRDSGCGINDSIVQALNNNNNKRIDHTKTQSQSTGIGLWLAKTMAEKNGGDLKIYNELNGTSISVSLSKYKHHEQTESTYS